MGDFVCVEPCTFDQLPAATEVGFLSCQYMHGQLPSRVLEVSSDWSSA